MSGYVAPSTLQALGVPENLAETFAPYLSACFEGYDITTDNRKAAFLGRACGAETSGLRRMTEIASGKAYNNNRDLDNGPNDGPTFKGRGIMQLTGRDAYTQYTSYVQRNYAAIAQRYRSLMILPAAAPNFVTSPALIASLPWSVDSAGWFWKHYKSWLHFNTLADAGNFDAISRGINGGTNGLSEYRNALAVARRVLPQQGSPVPTQPPIAIMQGPVVLPPIATLPPVGTAGGVDTGSLADLVRILGIKLPGTSTTGAGGSWLTGQTGGGAFSLDMTAGSSASSSAGGYDLVARLQKIKTEHVLALIGLSFLLIKPDLKRRKELLR